MWWLDEHRALTALFVLALGVLVAFTEALTRGPAASTPEKETSAVERSLAAGLIEEAKRPGPLNPDPDAAISKVDTLRERIEQEGENNVIGPEVGRAAGSHDCSAAAGGAVVDVKATLPNCEPAAALVAAYRSGLGAGQIRTIDDFTCSPLPDLQVSCTRTQDAASVILLFGPGGPGLDDCRRSPIGESASLSHVRADGIDCNEARERIFAAVAAYKPTDVAGLSCSRTSVGDVETMSCEGGEGSLSFILPAGS